jgi:hypothetical protein
MRAQARVAYALSAVDGNGKEQMKEDFGDRFSNQR